MMHYHATEEDHAKLEKKGFLLVDSGATYMDGTTDITRTYPLGELTEDERLFYTWTLQCHIDIARAVWLDYCDGHMLDTIAREPLWRHLINYRCGTGHSVSHVGNVHEGPHALNGRNTTVFKPGMIVTDEPGVYEAASSASASRMSWSATTKHPTSTASSWHSAPSRSCPSPPPPSSRAF